MKTILVVDDDPLHIELMTELLTTPNRAVLTAHDGQEAIEFLNSHIIDLIISDIEMPRMNGFALHREIQRDERLKLIPFLYLTGLEDTNSLSYINERPSLIVLRKPDLEYVLTVVDSMIPS